MRYRAIAQVAAGALAVVAVAGFGSGRPTRSGDGDGNAGTGSAAPSGVAATFQYAFVEEGDVIEAADAVIRGTILAVSEPRWNQTSGERWSMDADRPKSVAHPPAAFMLQTVDLAVAEVWRGRDVQPGDRVAFDVLGNGIGAAWNKEGAFLAPGTEVVVLLDRRSIGWRDGPGGRKEVLTLSGAYQGVYRVEVGGGLTNASTARLKGARDRASSSGDAAAQTSGAVSRSGTVAALKARVLRQAGG